MSEDSDVDMGAGREAEERAPTERAMEIEREDEAPAGVLLDSLPYIDFDFGDAESRAMVDAMVAQEMENSQKTPQQCLDELGLPPAPELDMKRFLFLSTELTRLEEGDANPPVDMSRYSLSPPTGPSAESFEAWAESVEKAMVQLEHQTVSLVNVELLRRFGGNSWKAHNEYVQQLHERLAKALQNQRKEMNALNLERSKAQTAAGAQYLSLERDFQERALKNHEIELECHRLEKEIEKMTKRLKTKEQGGSKKKQKTGKSKTKE